MLISALQNSMCVSLERDNVMARKKKRKKQYAEVAAGYNDDADDYDDDSKNKINAYIHNNYTTLMMTMKK